MQPRDVFQMDNYTDAVARLDAFIEQCLSEGRVHELVRLNTYLRRYLSPLVIARLFRSGELPHVLVQQECETIAALVLDMRGFVRTTQSGERSTLGLDGVAHLLHTFFTRTIRIAFEYYGLVGELAGDRVMILFGFPPEPDHSQHSMLNIAVQRAVGAALAIRRLSDDLRADTRFPVTMRQFEVGIGISAGKRAWIGDIGSAAEADLENSWRQELTIISESANTAARAEELTKHDEMLAAAPERKIIVDGPVYESICETMGAQACQVAYLGLVQLRGLDEPGHLYQLLDIDARVLPQQESILASHRALVAWICERIDGAIERNLANRIQRSLSDIGQIIATRTLPDQRAVFDQIMDQIVASFGAAKATLYRLDRNSNELVSVVSIGPNPLPAGFRLSIAQGIAGYVARTGESLVIADVHTDPRWSGGAHDPATHAMMCAPMKTGATVVGVIQVLDNRAGVYSASDLISLNAFSGLATIALENARIYEQTLRATRARAIITDAFSTALSQEEVLDAVMRAIDATLAPRNATLYLVDQETGELIFEKVVSESANPPRRHTRLPADTGIVGAVVRQKQPRLIRDTRNDTDWYGRIGSDIRSIVCVPLIAKGRVVGAIQMLDRTPDAYSEEDLEILKWLSASAAVAVDNAAQLEQARRKLIAADSIAGVGAIAGKLAHNLKNQVTAIRALARLLHDAIDNADLREDIDGILEAAGKAQQEIVEFMQPLTGWEAEHVDIHTVLHQYLTGVLEQLLARERLPAPGARISVVTEFAAMPLMVFAGRDHLQYIFRNLVDNAIRAIDEAGRAEGHILVRSWCESINETSYAVIAVQDDGIGIAPEHIDRVFDQRFTTRPEGTVGGYGLFWVRLNVERLGGRITISSEPGKGTTCSVRLPLSSGERLVA
ncbi:MAG: GAF domain-containing protein [Chloroflexi bacterium]|nr:GAF domain-containing protein [Chloroflexota bacterium]